jgi:WD40 repeat protein
MCGWRNPLRATRPVPSAKPALLMKASTFTLLSASLAFCMDAASAIEPSRDQAILIRHDRDFQAIGFNADGHLLGYSSSARAFIVDDLSETPSASGCWPSPDEASLISGALSKDGETAALVFEVNRRPGRLVLCDSRSGKRRDPAFDPAPVAFVAFSSDGQSLAGVGEHEVFVFDARTGKLTSSMAAEKRSQVGWIGVEFSPNDQFLATRNSYVTYTWDVVNSRMIGSLASGFFLSVSRDWGLAAKAEELVGLRDPRSPRALAPQLPREVQTNLNWVALSDDSKLVALQTRQGTVRFWDVPSGKLLHPELSVPARRVSMAFSPDRRCLAIHENDPTRRDALFDGAISLWEVSSGRRINEPAKVHGLLRDWHFNPRSRYLAASLSIDKWSTVVWKLPGTERNE